MGPVLQAEDITAGYTDVNILHGAGVHVDEGEVVCIIGPNGAGKSTLIKAIFGLLRISGGKVLLDGKDITNLAPDRVVAAGLGYVPQVQNVFATLTVEENLDMGAYLRTDPGETHPFGNFFGRRKFTGIRDAKERVYGLFPVLKERRTERVGRMSGGQRQMVAIARALMLNPRVLLLDEPSAGLAPNLQDAVFEQVRAIADEGTPILLVEQNAKKALAKSDRGIVLDQGRNRFEGKGRDLLHDPNVGKLYLGGGSKERPSTEGDP